MTAFARRIVLAPNLSQHYSAPMSRDDRSVALRLVPVSRETLERLDLYVGLLDKWRKTINLISEASFAEVWSRHIADSAQLLALAPNAKIWVDLGSGAGFPGLVLAIQLSGRSDARVHLIESDQRKSAFLREAARQTGAAAIVHNDRIEDAALRITDAVDAVTARALAPLPQLVAVARMWLDHGAIGIFPRGKTGGAIDSSLIQNFLIDFPRSRTDQMSTIAIVRRLSAPLAAISPPGLAEP
jgi:16S rRNA (guanine527-N7)-methyltransferase